MNLKEYASKRDFKKTCEPKKSVKSSSKALNFCVQKHNARQLHYDFRLEYHGVLLSWAVPKGPSLNPQDKRLAIKVEDHPLDYQYFEGVIPKGNYGAGTVETWDHGHFTIPGATDRKEIEKRLTEGLKTGHFAIILHGERLNGEFVLQKLKKDPDDKAWLLIKKSNEHDEASKEIIHTPSKFKKPKKIPTSIHPMLAVLIESPFDNEDWLFEVKWDGFRSLAFIEHGKVELKSRNNLLFNTKFPSLVKSLERSKGSAILDGEIVVVDKKGKSHFQLVQNYKEGEGTLCYYVFDILFKDGIDIREIPLIERKEILQTYLKQLNQPLIRYNDHVLRKGKAFFKAAIKAHLEGIIGKKITSIYQSSRSKDWVKIKTSLRQEFVICGFTEPRGTRKKFGALIAGIYNKKNELKYAGLIGSGFNENLLKDIYDKLLPLIQKKCPFNDEPKVNMPVVWVKPKLVGEVSFAEWTKDNIMRQPIFQGLRIDKSSKEVKEEIPEHPPKEKISLSKKIKGLTLTHLEKIYWPKEKYTKGDLIAYYESVAPYILPYLKNRPIMLHRLPDGIEGKDFYQKDINFSHPDWIKTYPVRHEGGKIDNYLVINNIQSLLYAINLGSIDLHPFLSRESCLDKPDFCVIDLDPHDITFDKVIEAALVVHDVLEKANVSHYCKTSGGKGLHILIPLKAKYDYEQSRRFAEVICHIVHSKLPKTTSMERSPEKRSNKIYLDCLQNRLAQSIVSPYAVRPRPKAMVSTPLFWEEVNQDLNISDYTIETIPARLQKIGDILKPVLGSGVNIKKALQALEI